MEQLDANGCFLSGLHVRSTRLRVLYAKGCRYLESLSLASRPDALDLGNCERLEHLSIGQAARVNEVAGVQGSVRLAGCTRLSQAAMDDIGRWATLSALPLRM